MQEVKDAVYQSMIQVGYLSFIKTEQELDKYYEGRHVSLRCYTRRQIANACKELEQEWLVIKIKASFKRTFVRYITLTPHEIAERKLASLTTANSVIQ